MEVFVFIYSKNGQIKALNHINSLHQHNYLISQNYKHIATIDACTWIEFIFNNPENIDIMEYLKGFINRIETTVKNIES